MGFAANIKCLCSGCPRKCSSAMKSEFALKGRLTYVYLKNGSKLTNTCEYYNNDNHTPNPIKPVFLGREGLLKIV